ncbi:hypothetical protein CVT26_016187 [Gymnopilus dilepis]|uniref:RanBD1 domain-containing protein n=1 Tax=Gymnopilus dilepis TaxID=231916 RepID=A0A409XZ26_9AGAR|nr:hypothetical protein CVT26_016187 [Gymnopilus dilepis]
MFPVADFSFVAAGLATFAATVGYACSRRLSNSFTSTHSDILRETLVSRQSTTLVEKTTEALPADEMLQDKEALPTEEVPVSRGDLPAAIQKPVRTNSLKRKIPHDGFDEPEKEPLGYPHNLANIYPNKRSRTPSSDSDSTTSNPKPTTILNAVISRAMEQDIDIPLVSSDPQPMMATSPVTDPPRTPSPAVDESTPRETEVMSDPLDQIAEPPASLLPPHVAEIPRVEPPRPISPRPVTPKPFASPSTGFGSYAVTAMNSKPATPKPFASPSGGFAAFASPSSPFATLGKPKELSSKTVRSIWSSGDLKAHQNEGEPANVLGEAFKPLSEDDHVLGEAKATPLHPSEKYTHVTGEEDEEVVLEQKGVKLYTKRGDKPFSEGVVGHMKLLSNRTTHEERILFRREPLWKVSMNVRVRPSVHCTYAPEEHALRLVLTEASSETQMTEDSKPETSVKQEVVVYAMKPGRSCSKQDFKVFAEALLERSQFKETSSTADHSKGVS